MLAGMYTIVRGGQVLGENWEREVRWIRFADLVKEVGTQRSFIRFPSAESTAPVAAKLGGQVAEVLVHRGGDKFEIVLYRPPPRVGPPAAVSAAPAEETARAPKLS